jgi:hypothetical protein
MQRVFYAGGFFLTSDQIAAAVVDYAHAVVASSRTDVVYVPIVEERTSRQTVATLLIGPSTQILSLPVEIRGLTDPIDTEIIEELERRALLLGAPPAMPQAWREGIG